MYNDLCTGANVDMYIMDGRFVLKEKQKTLSSLEVWREEGIFRILHCILDFHGDILLNGAHIMIIYCSAYDILFQY